MSAPNTPFATLTGVRHPLIQAPMAGGATTPELVAAVCNAGALGSFAAATLSPAAMREGVARVRALTDRPFNVNLFILENPDPSDEEVARAQARLDPLRAELGLPPGSRPARFCEDNRAQIETLLELAPPLVSFTFGLLDATTVARFHAAGCRVIGTATTVAEALAWQAVGADLICAQGSEAGGHRGTFLGDPQQSCLGLLALLPQVVAAVNIPVIAAGGIMDGRGIAAALLLGAQAAQLGTAFLCCPESGIPSIWKEAILAARDDSTRLTRAFSGRLARGIANDFMRRLAAAEDEVPAYPVQNALTGDIRQAAVRQGRSEYLSLWAGQAAGMARTLPAGELVRTLMEEMAACRP
ncbi:nitronate monooxygenase [Pseudomonas linyingensis]|uniref:Nitronate monooxygenase n=1 Tax=Pseudomonas linyingensis TaxID=915471 RepID=A0A1H6URW8_9PSED|nr:nitronate monooxygenase [Pseudomonas linyingensis]SEI94978.1 nitronate monooxygenase [Pseudomonas linyingensis]